MSASMNFQARAHTLAAPSAEVWSRSTGIFKFQGIHWKRMTMIDLQTVQEEAVIYVIITAGCDIS